MNEKLSFEKKIKKNNLFEIFLNFIKKNIIIFLIISSIFLTLVLSIFFLYKSNNYYTLYNNLSNEDKNAIVLELSNMNVPYKINNSENKIKIPRNLIYQVRMNLSEKGIPKENINGFEILDKEKFGESQFHEKINYQRALEGELAKTIMKIDFVKNASVHLVINSKSIFINNDIDSSASILLTLKSGKSLNANKINAILHLVSTSVYDLKYKNITIVDQYGNLLNQSPDLDLYSNSKLIYISNIEREYKRKIEEILVPLFGINNIHAQVTAQINFDKKEKVEEKYKPNSNILNKSIRSNQSVYSKEFHSTDKSIDIKENYLKKKNDKNVKKNINSDINKKDIYSKDNTNNNNISNNGDYTSNYDNTTNYELDHNVVNTTKNVGNLKRISVGVIINYIKDSKGKFVPLNLNDIEKIKCLVKHSIGFSKQRGDKVDLVNSLFFKQPEVEQENKIFMEKSNSNFSLKDYLFISSTIISIIFFYELLLKKIFFYILNIKKEENKNDEIKNENINKKKDIDKKINKKNTKEQKSSNALVITKKDENNKNIFEKKSLFIANIIRNWINKK